MKQIGRIIIIGLILLAYPTLSALADGAAGDAVTLSSAINTEGKTFADFLWMMIAGFLVFFMQAGFALVETGFTRAKNVANIMMKNMMDFGMGTLVFFLVGFAFMYGNDVGGFIGMSNFALSDAINASGEMNHWMYADWFFQAVFAATAATIVSGAVAERTKFSGYLMYTVVITALIYPIVGHWVWGGGWLSQIGFYDFAGSTVVHSVGAWAGLVGTWIIGPRIGRFKGDKANPIPGHSVALGSLGVFILWLGWFGFNPGSTLGADISFARIAVTTNLAGAAGAVSAMIFAWSHSGHPDIGYTLNGALAGLVAITAPAAVVSPVSAIIIGAVGGAIMYWSVLLIEKMRIDDPVGAIPVHGFAGAWGTLSVGLFAQAPYTTQFTGIFFGGSGYQLFIQSIGILAVLAWTLSTAYIVFKSVNVFHGLRVTRDEELTGLDRHEHGTSAYPEFFGVHDAREMMDLDEEEELELIEKNRLGIDLEE